MSTTLATLETDRFKLLDIFSPLGGSAGLDRLRRWSCAAVSRPAIAPSRTIQVMIPSSEA